MNTSCSTLVALDTYHEKNKLQALYLWHGKFFRLSFYPQSPLRISQDSSAIVAVITQNDTNIQTLTQSGVRSNENTGITKTASSTTTIPSMLVTWTGASLVLRWSCTRAWVKPYFYVHSPTTHARLIMGLPAQLGTLSDQHQLAQTVTAMAISALGGKGGSGDQLQGQWMEFGGKAWGWNAKGSLNSKGSKGKSKGHGKGWEAADGGVGGGKAKGKGCRRPHTPSKPEEPAEPLQEQGTLQALKAP